MPAKTSVRPEDVLRRVGDTTDRALAYVANPDPQLARLSRKVREGLIPDLPPVTAGALLGPAALARHLVASAASGRYCDLFALWELFRSHPAEVKPVLAERQRALDKAHAVLDTAVRLGLRGRAERVAEDVVKAEGLIWQWLQEILQAERAIVAARPAVASALLNRDPQWELPLPDEPDERWLAEAAAACQTGPLAPPINERLAAGVERLPATLATLSLAQQHYPEQVPTLIDRVDLDDPSVPALLAWARDHGHSERLRERIAAHVASGAERSRADGLAAWYTWRQRGVEVDLPEPLRRHDIADLDLTRPETAELVAHLRSEGAPLDAQQCVRDLAGQNRQAAEKAYEAFVCAGLDVTLPVELESNPLVKLGTRCPSCQAWTYVRAGHERRCPRAKAAQPA